MLFANCKKKSAVLHKTDIDEIQAEQFSSTHMQIYI